MSTDDQLESNSESQDEKPAYHISAEVRERFDKILAEQAVQNGLKFIEADHEKKIAEQIEITEIPSPPFNESVRAEDFARRLKDLGMKDIHVDKEGNAIGTLKGTEGVPKLVVSAHLDTVFPKGYDSKVTVDEKGVLHAPGVSDDGAGLAAILSVARTLKETGIKTVGDILFVGTVGEEGRGDLRGVKYLFSSMEDIDGFMSVDGDGVKQITYLALGSKRFEFTFKGTGGHSFGAFGKVASPIHAMGRAIQKIANIKVPEHPKTTFAVSIVNGGTSINSIAAEATMQTDTRSESQEQLDITVSELVNCVKAAVIEENAHWKIPWDSPDNVEVVITKVGDRPCGTCEPDAVHVQAALASAEALGIEPELEPPGSTDSSLPICLNVPALTLGRGGKGYNIHSPQESFDPVDAYLASQRVFLTVLGLAGMADSVKPLLGKHAGYTYEFTGVPVPEGY